ncbi:hypothetical protein TraAM80_01108 [Trypanosoma rangeli]|uniref:Uncharacterized protein n=1 Tax=Trypanosoma rangeli TaxID=5698 RepID=A0A3S5ISH0_TRYRA|nr:uncharacterized protein TraAM80_01108 [Trypanosoma rangeli]RNF11177.1 hypothetical protein TraAM80_01108 [Trypanosoma rangeli]|eukprot:RNF11177.1 hypothetical protein TraAM80_01108 [Trypanosoma rangeli]
MRFFVLLWGLLLVYLSLDVGRICRAADEAPMYRVEQQVSSDWVTRSITFLSSGYAVEEEVLFQSDVNLCVRALHGRIRGVTAEPWDRYASLLNIYAVFQPSVESGAASKEDLKGGRNNLGCSITLTYPPVVSCDLNAVFRLAAYAPVQDLVVVLVNQPKAAVGVGGKSIAIFTNDPLFMPFFVIRELSKAVTSLGSEYAFGVEDKHVVQVPNCAPSIEAARAAWGHWIDQGLADETPLKGCFFNNYYRPTRQDCIMRNSSVGGLCAVCKEQVNLALLSADLGDSTAHTRCIRDTPNLIFNRFQDLQIHIGEIGGMTDMKVDWMLADGSIVGTANDSQLVIALDSLRGLPLPTEICAVITDNSPYIRPKWRAKLLRRIASFRLVSDTSSTPVNVRRCGMSEVCKSCQGPHCDETVLSHPNVMKWAVEEDVKVRRNSYVILVAVYSGVAIVLLLIVLVLYLRCYLRRPHEIFFNPCMDRVNRGVLLIISVIITCMSTFTLVSIPLLDENHFIFLRKLFIPFFVMTTVTYLFSLLNFVAVIFRLYIFTVICGAVLLLIGLFHAALGALLGLAAGFVEDFLVGYAASGWMETAHSNPSQISRVQSHLKCSGFFVSCLEVASSICPVGSESNLHAEPCATALLKALYNMHTALTVSIFITGALVIVCGLLDFVFVLRSLHLSRMGRRRRMYRNDPHAAVLPLVFAEARRAHRMFCRSFNGHGRTLEAQRVTGFLERVFGTKLKPEEKGMLEAEGPFTFNGLMSFFFPHFITSRMDPRQLTPEEAHMAQGVFELQCLQFQKLWKFATASAAMSPGKLCGLFRLYTRDNFVVEPQELLALIKKAADTNSIEAALYRGLTTFELEGLRNAWAVLKPNIIGDLNDEQIALFYQWTHRDVLRGDNHLKEWKQSLDVRRRGRIGWGEFCYPFAKRALLWKAREFLSNMGKEVPPELLKKEFVQWRFGNTVVNATFLPYEDEIPIERVLEYVLSHAKGKQRKRKEL